MQKRRILNFSISVIVLTVLALLYGLSLYRNSPKYCETILLGSGIYLLFSAAVLRFIPHLVSFLAGDEQPHLIRSGDRTYRRCGTRELGKLVLLILILRVVELVLTYVVHYYRFGYTDTFFEVQRIWLDFYHPETAFPLYNYVSTVFWIFTFNFNHARFIGSYVFTALAGAALYALVLFDFDRKMARRAVRYLFFLPVSCLFLGTVPDGLFLLLAFVSLLFMRRRSFALANLFAMLATVAHAFGVLLFFPILAEYLSVIIGNVRSNKEMEKWYFAKQIVNAISFVLIPVGVVFVLLYSQLRFGDSLHLYRAFVQADAAGGGLPGALFRWLDTVWDNLHLVRAETVPSFLATSLVQILYFVAACLLLLLGSGRVDAAYVLLLAVSVPAVLMTNQMNNAAHLMTITASFCIILAASLRKRWLDYVFTFAVLLGWGAYFYAFICGYTGGVV